MCRSIITCLKTDPNSPVAVEDEHIVGVIVVPNPVKDFLEITNEE